MIILPGVTAETRGVKGTFGGGAVKRENIGYKGSERPMGNKEAKIRKVTEINVKERRGQNNTKDVWKSHKEALL